MDGDSPNGYKAPELLNQWALARVVRQNAGVLKRLSIAFYVQRAAGA